MHREHIHLIDAYGAIQDIEIEVADEDLRYDRLPALFNDETLMELAEAETYDYAAEDETWKLW